VIAVDTNVLLRRLLNDDVSQAPKAQRLFDSGEPILITDIVLAETIWTLKGKRYGASREEIAAVVTSLMEEPHVIFENKQAVWSALNDYLAAAPVKTASGLKFADYADALIVNKAKHTANRRHETYKGTFTFDQAALEITGTKKL
jgi:predicted nucleic-acid-binding protein